MKSETASSPSFAAGTAASLFRLPLYTQVLIAVIGGTILGALFGQAPYLGGLGNEDLGRFGMYVIFLLKILAIPLIFFAVLDAFLMTVLPLRQGTRLMVICLINVSVAMAIGLVIMNLWQPGLTWRSSVDALLNLAPASAGAAERSGSGRPFEEIASYIPRTMLQPFTTNNVIGVVVLALVLGAALRRFLGAEDNRERSIEPVARVVGTIYRWLVRILWWIIRLVPFAVFGVLASIVGRVGLDVFSALWIFLVAILVGLSLHAFVYYPLVAWLAGNKPLRIYLGRGVDAIMTAISCNSSLATVPVTLRCLERMDVSPQSARLAACVGTTLNNDGVTLYEAMAALFLAQALGYELSIGHQLLIVAASIMAGIGVAGIPEAGLIVLPLVLSAAGLPNSVIAAAIPLIMSVDWILARVRSGVNVMSDMLVAILLDRLEQNGASEKTASVPSKSSVL
ncbi:MAG TPA: dicarboxylate/amino acid:cation symporter [Nitrospira sp.]|nr:dicarboxylate/amino acid:cation symporter [Nitrospira sp.]